MAIIKCPECGQEVSDKAGVCIHCGCPLTVEANIVTVRFPADEDGLIKLKYCITDAKGKVLGNGRSGESVSFTLDKSTELKCSILGGMYSGYKSYPIVYKPHGTANYTAIRVNKGFKSFVEMQEDVMGYNMRANEPEPTKKETTKSGGASAFGVFIAVLLAGLVLWYMMSPYTTPTWVQHIGGTIKATLRGEDSYTIMDWDQLNGK